MKRLLCSMSAEESSVFMSLRNNPKKELLSNKRHSVLGYIARNVDLM